MDKLMATAHAATVATVATASAALGVLLGLALASLSRTRRKRHAPLVFEGCAEHRLRSEAGLKYKLQVSLPHTYGEDPSRRYPAIFALDGEPYLFPLLATVARTQHFFCRSTWYPDFIIVGITADLEEDFTSESVDVRTLWSDLRATRARDYLPTQAESPWGYPGAGSLLEVSGHATTFVNFLVSRLVPFVDNVYRTSAERALIGKSLGGSGVAHALLESRDVFQYFLLGSPSLAWDEGAFFRLEESHASRAPLNAEVYLCYGGSESEAMVANAQEFKRCLDSRGYPQLVVSLDRVEDEDHGSVSYPFAYRALRWLRDRLAQYNLGAEFLTGKRVQKDPARAFELFREAAGQEHAAAMCNLGVMYAQGLGVQKDPLEARRWYEKAADRGDASGLFNLALLCAEDDPRRARQLAQLAQKKGHSQAGAFLSSLPGPEEFWSRLRVLRAQSAQLFEELRQSHREPKAAALLAELLAQLEMVQTAPKAPSRMDAEIVD
ncbi:unnamed protein product [Effrenium voratum]|nr:unnamed protein product [Effrenium voratum]